MRDSESLIGRPASLLRVSVDSLKVFDPSARSRLLFLLVLMLCAAALEAIGAALIVPFVAMISDPTYFETQPILRDALSVSELQSPDDFIVAAALVLLVFFCVKNAFLVYVAHCQFGFLYKQLPRVSNHIFRESLARPFERAGGVNSAITIRSITTDVPLFFTNFLIPAMTVVTEGLVTLAMLAVLVLLAPVPALVAIGLLGGLTSIFYRVVRERVRQSGRVQQHHSAERMKWVSQAIDGLKELKLLGREGYFLQRYAEHEVEYANANRYSMVLSQTPRLFIETLAFSALFLGVAASLSLGGDRAAVLPVLALFAVSAVRLLPSMNRIMLSITRMAHYRPSAEVVLTWFRKQDGCADSESGADPSRVQFGEWRRIELRKVSFSYSATTQVLSRVDVSIERGSTVAIVGPSGGGKTTLVDIVLGLIQPHEGAVYVDGFEIHSNLRDWQSRIGYVPQTIYLLDDSIRRNVAFGIPDSDIDDQRVWESLKLACLDSTVRSLEGALDFHVGENGARLSGGQRQRLVIARALYAQPQLLVMDEATSALDEETERGIGETITMLAGTVTVLVIAHRPETIARCQIAYAVENASVVTL